MDEEPPVDGRGPDDDREITQDPCFEEAEDLQPNAALADPAVLL